MIDLDKWAAVLTEFTPGMYRRMLGRELLNMDRDPFASLKQTYSEFIAARPTDAPVLIDPARLRELERDAARYRGLRNVAANGTPSLEREFDGQVDEALQEQPNV